MHVHVLRTFTCVSAASAASPAPTHPSIKESTKGSTPLCGGGAKRRLLYFLTFLGSTFKNSFENDVKRQKVRFGVSISLLGYVKSTLNVY